MAGVPNPVRGASGGRSPLRVPLTDEQQVALVDTFTAEQAYFRRMVGLRDAAADQPPDD